VIDSQELMPRETLSRTLDASAALARIGLITRIDSHAAARWSPGLGSLLGSTERLARAHCTELRVPMPPDRHRRYVETWHTFLAAFDRFVATRAGAGFGTFVQQARKDPAQRPALRAWHDAVSLASWHDNKAATVASLLQQHRGQRTLVFTPDRRSAYELARQHLIPAVTAEIPRAERAALLDAFHTGSILTLAGPRLLDVGVPEGTADVAILAGGGYGVDQRAARVRRVRRGGQIYELLTQDSLEVGRARRWRAHDADATVTTHDR